MPNLFRVITGQGSSSVARSNNPQQRNNNNRSTYPGQRTTTTSTNFRPTAAAQQHQPQPPGGGSRLPTETPRYGAAVQSVPQRPVAPTAAAAATRPTAGAAQQAPARNTAGNLILRGNPVVSSSNAARTAAPPPPPASTTTTTTETTTRPGAYQVSRTTSGPAQVYRVVVPQGVRPNTEFSVHAGQRRVRVRCPPTSRPGQSLQITLPPEHETHHFALRMAPLTCADAHDETGGGGAVPMTPEVRRVNDEAQAHGGTAQTFLVTIPPNIYPGMQFTVNVAGQRFMVTCPQSAGPNMKVRIVPPQLPQEPQAAPKTQVFEVAVPPGVVAGQPFALVANGQRVLVTCPPNVSAGQKIRFQLPVSQVVGNIQLQYESEQGGWSRTIRATDLKFQWVRLDGIGGASNTSEKVVNDSSAFEFAKSAYVRQLVFLEGNDARMRTGTLELVPASEAVVDSRLVVNNMTLLSYAEIASAQGKSLEDKISWFQSICTRLTPAWEDGHIQIKLRRQFILSDSVEAIMSLGRDDLRKRWRIEFMGEEAIDAGGVSREWFQQVSEQIYDPDFGLWLPSINNQMCVNINPASAMSCPEDHLVYFRFLGRILGRALFDRQLISGHMVRTLYKHLLGWPVTFEDVKAQDEMYYDNLKKLSAETNSDHIEAMCLDFTVSEEAMGIRQDVELVKGGQEMPVTSENLMQYLEANLKYRLMNRTKPQLTELLLGFYDIIPEPALTVFDANELELILCGLPNIDLEDWKENTKYSGLFASVDGTIHPGATSNTSSDKTVEWFWEVVKEYDDEMKARLLQFVTGTSGVPSRGFSVLQGIDGDIKKFTVHGVDLDKYPLPRAHTCFNRIDLPNYRSKADLKLRLTQAITMCGVGFDME